jgi:hypothetical protein
MKNLWRKLLALYPPAYRESFAAEMETVFNQAAEERRSHGHLAFAGFLIAEYCGALQGAAGAWLAEARKGPILVGVPGDTASIQTLIEQNLRRMENAIATHRFEKARFYSYYDLQLRERLRRMATDEHR